MSHPSNDPSKSKTPTIKIAASNADQRASGGGVDPGPGDPSAAPSSAPMSVDIPEPPTSSQLVVKSTSTKSPSSAQPSALGTMYQNTRSGMSKSHGPSSQVGSQVSGGLPKEPTSSRALTGPERSKSGAKSQHSQGAGGPLGGSPSVLKTASSTAGTSRHSKSHHSVSGSHHSSRKSHVSGAGGGMGSGRAGGASGAGMPEPSASPVDTDGASPTADEEPNTASTAMKADSVHQEDEEGEGEIGEGTPSPASGADGGPDGANSQAATEASQASAGVKSSASGRTHSPDMSGVPASSGAGASKMSTKTGGRRSTTSASDFPSTASGASSSSMKDKSLGSGASSSSAVKSGKDGKKVTKFRYHKRITVRTHGKTSPSTILAKVNQKDHKAGITASTIDDMDPKEIMRRAGIPANKKAHWRVRLRQTKRLTKNGKTATQTKVIYRDSEGNKRVKRSTDPYCKKCGKKLDDCKCKS